MLQNTKRLCENCSLFYNKNDSENRLFENPIAKVGEKCNTRTLNILYYRVIFRYKSVRVHIHIFDEIFLLHIHEKYQNISVLISYFSKNNIFLI